MEQFLEFKDFHKNKKKASEIAQMNEKVLDDKGTDIGDCKGQDYDNGTNMSGRVKSVQAQCEVNLARAALPTLKWPGLL